MKVKLEAAFNGVDAVIHLAALIDIAASVADPASTNDVNVTRHPECTAGGG